MPSQTTEKRRLVERRRNAGGWRFGVVCLCFVVEAGAVAVSSESEYLWTCVCLAAATSWGDFSQEFPTSTLQLSVAKEGIHVFFENTMHKFTAEIGRQKRVESLFLGPKVPWKENWYWYIHSIRPFQRDRSRPYRRVSSGKFFTGRFTGRYDIEGLAKSWLVYASGSLVLFLCLASLDARGYIIPEQTRLRTAVATRTD